MPCQNCRILIPSPAVFINSPVCQPFFLDEENPVIFSKTEAGVRTQGVIDSLSGNILLDGYDTLWMAGGGLFSVQIGSTHGLVDLSGSWIWKSDKYGTY